MLTYAQFYKAHGLRLMSQLLSPPLSGIETFKLPVNSIYHHIEDEIDAAGILPDDLVLQHHKDPVLIDHISTYTRPEPYGRPRVAPFQFTQIVSEYHREHKGFKRFNNSASMLTNNKLLLVISYSLIARHYIYTDVAMNAYYRYRNLYETVFKTAGEWAKTNDRQQYIRIHLPNPLPPISWLNDGFSNGVDTTFVKRFNTESMRFLEDLWAWVGEKRRDSSLGGLSHDQLSRINLLLVQGAKWCVINLGVIDSWIMQDENDKVAPGGIRKITREAMQKRLLRGFMSVIESMTQVADLSEVDTAQVEPDVITDDGDPLRKDLDRQVDSSSDKPDRNYLPGKTSKPTDPKKQGLVNMIGTAAGGDNDKASKGAEEPEMAEEDIEKDLHQLEVIGKRREEEASLSSTYRPYQPPEEDLASGVQKVADMAARAGKLSAPELRRINRISTRFKDIPNPHTGKGSLEELLTIKPEELQIPETNPILDHIPGVVDKSMLSSSIITLEEDYPRQILKKDIASCVLALQKGGIAIQDYTVHQTDDYTDSFDVHRIKLVPAVGKPTTINIRLPRIDSNGTFRARGVRYRMRKQRGDWPIRKTAPDQVSLTSYMSKMFVVRSERAVFNYAEWLVNGIVAKGVDIGDDTVTDIQLANVFDNEQHLPRAYTTIAQRVAGFRSGPYLFTFDFSKRDVMFGKEVIDIIRKSGGNKQFTPVGTYSTGILVMDQNDIIYKVDTVDDKAGIVEIGLIEQIVGLPLEKRPYEVAEVDIFGKTIPVGFVLAYHIGLGNLITTLGVEYRRVPKGSNYNLTVDEYILRFEDEALIFDRNDRVATMILAGFERYHRSIKQESVYAFDKKDVYANVLEENGIGSRYVREFDTLFDMWIDPITRDLLKQMKEPTDLFRLFIRATELLTTDHHPDEMDQAVLREKGYERFAGIMYFELIKAMRAYKSKPANANASFDLNPEAVWMNILKDQTVMPVEESNPIHCLKEKEVVVFSGAGGRTGRSMTAKSRTYHKNCLGVVSEATVDSGDVATITYLTADPNLDSMRGTSRRIGDMKGKAAKLVSTSMLLAPGSDIDD